MRKILFSLLLLLFLSPTPVFSGVVIRPLSGAAPEPVCTADYYTLTSGTAYYAFARFAGSVAQGGGLYTPGADISVCEVDVTCYDEVGYATRTHKGQYPHSLCRYGSRDALYL